MHDVYYIRRHSAAFAEVHSSYYNFSLHQSTKITFYSLGLLHKERGRIQRPQGPNFIPGRRWQRVRRSWQRDGAPSVRRRTSSLPVERLPGFEIQIVTNERRRRRGQTDAYKSPLWNCPDAAANPAWWRGLAAAAIPASLGCTLIGPWLQTRRPRGRTHPQPGIRTVLGTVYVEMHERSW